MGFSTGVAAKIEGEIVVEDVCPGHVPVNNQFQVVSNSASGRVDAVFVADFCHEVRGWVYFVAIDK